VTVTVIVLTRNDYIFCSDRALKRFFRPFCVCKVTFLKILEVQGHRHDLRIELANTLVGNANKLSVKKKFF